MANSSDERTEKPTGKRRQDARLKGQVARSRELSSAGSLAAVTLGLSYFGAQMITTVAQRMASGLATLGDHARDAMEPTAITTQLVSDAGVLVSVAGPPAMLAALVSVALSLAQVGFLITPKAMQLNWGRLNPAAGLSRLSPAQAGPELLKSVLSMAVVGFVGYLFVRQCVEQAPALMAMTPIEAAHLGWSRLWTLLWRTSLALVALAAADYGWQRWRWFSSLKMTRQEIRDEAKMNEGNPEIKQRVRRVQREMFRNRMLKAVERATVVITNPTHFAVALEYRRGEMSAPVVVAKGQDHMAAKIRAIARERGVPIVENVTLARALYKTADIGDSIPADLFGAVAEVLAYLVRLKQLIL